MQHVCCTWIKYCWAQYSLMVTSPIFVFAWVICCCSLYVRMLSWFATGFWVYMLNVLDVRCCCRLIVTTWVVWLFESILENWFHDFMFMNWLRLSCIDCGAGGPCIDCLNVEVVVVFPRGLVWNIWNEALYDQHIEISWWRRDGCSLPMVVSSFNWRSIILIV